MVGYFNITLKYDITVVFIGTLFNSFLNIYMLVLRRTRFLIIVLQLKLTLLFFLIIFRGTQLFSSIDIFILYNFWCLNQDCILHLITFVFAPVLVHFFSHNRNFRFVIQSFPYAFAHRFDDPKFCNIPFVAAALCYPIVAA